MTPPHPVRAAFGAGLVLLAAVAVFGNQWFFDHVAVRDHGAVVSRLVHVVSTFSWRFTRLHGATTPWIAQIVGVLVVVVGVYLLVLLIAYRATGLALLIGAWGVTILVAMVGGFAVLLIEYGYLFGSNDDPEKLGRFWYAVFNGTEGAAVFGAAAGLLAGLMAMLLAGSPGNASKTTYRGVYVGGAPVNAPVGVYVPVAGAPAEPYDPTTQYQSQYSTPAQDQTGQYPYTSENESTPPSPPYDPHKTTVTPSAAEWTSPPPPPPPPWVAPEEGTTRD